MLPLLTQADGVQPLMLPDSVQKANLARSIEKVVNLDYKEFFMNMAGDAVWIVLKILMALAIYAVGRWLIRRMVKLLDSVFERRKIDASLRSFLRNTLKVVMTLILILSVIQTLGVNVTSIIALFASVTLAIGMALSGTAQNFAGGIMILLIKPYRVGDFISAQGQSGARSSSSRRSSPQVTTRPSTSRTTPSPRPSSTTTRRPTGAAWTGRWASPTATTWTTHAARSSNC